jgi:flavin-dependent dehydrogenase
VQPLSDRVVGVRLGGAVERARLVVGADGMRSAVAGFLDAPTTVENDRLTCAYYTFWEGRATDFELYEGPDGWAGAVPTNGAVLISAYFPHARFEEVRTNAETAYLDCLRTNAPPLYAQIQGARRAGRLTGTGDQRNFFRQAYGPGWVLVGDAGHHKDSISARGIGEAFLQADLLAGLVGDGLADEARLDRALKAYAEERDARLLDGYKATLVIAQPQARDRRRALLRAVGSDPGLTQRYFDTVAGVRPVAELYTPDLLALLNAQG